MRIAFPGVLAVPILISACGSDQVSLFPTVDAGDVEDTGSIPPTFGDDAGTSMSDAALQGDSNCTPQLSGLLRDFRGTNEPSGHPDFESAGARSAFGLDPDIVDTTLGSDRKPVFRSPTKSTTSQAAFDQWFRDVSDVNITEVVTLPFTIESSGRTTFDSASFFPLDGKGFGNTPGRTHNYHFTYELHTEFLYQGGEVFQFRGDDDVWVFINGKRVVDLGGVHGAESASVNVDARAAELGISVGSAYAFDFFFAERHTTESNFRLETTLKFVNCAPILPR